MWGNINIFLKISQDKHLALVVYTTYRLNLVETGEVKTFIILKEQNITKMLDFSSNIMIFNSERNQSASSAIPFNKDAVVEY